MPFEKEVSKSVYKFFRFVIVIALLAFVTSSGALAVAFPTVQYLGFNPNTWTYTYKVTQWNVPDSIYSFDHFEVRAYTPLNFAYSMSGIIVDGESWGWSNRLTYWNPGSGNVSLYIWYSGMGDPVPPGQYLDAPLVGYFYLTVPNTQPVPGIVGTMGGGLLESRNETSLMVPGMIPEPSSLAILAGMFVGSIPVIMRGRRK